MLILVIIFLNQIFDKQKFTIQKLIE